VLRTDFSINCAPNFIQNTDILITLGNAKGVPKKRTWVHNRLQ